MLSIGKSLEGKVAVVTGSGQGVGRGIAIFLAKEGAKVITNNRKPKSKDIISTNESFKSIGVKNEVEFNKDEEKKMMKLCGDAESTAKEIILAVEKYYVHQDYIYVNSGCDLKGLKERTLYKYKISTRELEEILEIPSNMSWLFLDKNNTCVYNNYLFTKVINWQDKYCLYINLDDPKGIRSEALPVDDYHEIDSFVGYGVIYYVMLNYDFSIHKYDLTSGEHNVILDRTGCGYVGERKEGLFKKVPFFMIMNEKPQVVGKWLYYRGNESGNILKVSKDVVNGTSELVNL